MKTYIKFLIIPIILIGTCFYFWSSHFSKKQSTELRAAIDIGSGATKMKIAEVDVKTQKIASVIFENQIAVAFQAELDRSNDETFTPQAMKDGIRAIKKLKKIADEHQVKKVVAVATAAFRQAKNAISYAEEIFRETGVKVHIIDQEQEGILSFNAAMANTQTLSSHALVWDIGGGSQQLTVKENGQDFYVCKGEIASIAFRNHIIENLQGYTLEERSTPNPILGHVAEQAVAYAKTIGQRIDNPIQNKVRNPQTTVFAVGSLFGYGIKNLVGENIISQQMLEKAIENRLGLSDEELHAGDFADVTVSNALLVLGTMQALNIEKIVIQDVNNADGALVNSSYYS